VPVRGPGRGGDYAFYGVLRRKTAAALSKGRISVFSRRNEAFSVEEMALRCPSDLTNAMADAILNKISVPLLLRAAMSRKVHADVIVWYYRVSGAITCGV